MVVASRHFLHASAKRWALRSQSRTSRKITTFVFLGSLGQASVDVASIRTALAHVQESLGLTVWARDPDILRSTTGFKYNGGEPKAAMIAARGAITWAMGETALAAIPDSIAKRGVRIALFVGLRKWEFLSLRKGDLSEDDTLRIRVKDSAGHNKNKGYSVRTHKKFKQGEEDLLVRKLVHPKQSEAIRLAEAGKRHGELLFPYVKLADRRKGIPDCNWETVNKFIQQLKIANAWPEELKFCPHSLRHGAIGGTLCHLKGINADENGIREAIGITRGARRFYQEPNESRISRVALCSKRKRLSSVSR